MTESISILTHQIPITILLHWHEKLIHRRLVDRYYIIKANETIIISLIVRWWNDGNRSRSRPRRSCGRRRSSSPPSSCRPRRRPTKFRPSPRETGTTVQVSLLHIGEQGLRHFFRYRPLLPIGWRTVQILHQRWRKRTNTAPPLLVHHKQQANPLLSTHNYNPLVISRNDTYKQLMPMQACIYRQKYVNGSVNSD